MFRGMLRGMSLTGGLCGLGVTRIVSVTGGVRATGGVRVTGVVGMR